MIKTNKTSKIPLICRDSVFKSVFIDNPNVLAKMISDITNTPYKDLKDNISYDTNELPIRTKKEKAKRTDFLVKIGANQVSNVELNVRNDKSQVMKNLSYIFYIYSSFTKKSKKYNKELQVSQINIDYQTLSMDKPVSKFLFREEDTGALLTESIIIYFLNIEKCVDIYYNKSEEKITNAVKWGAFLNSDNFDEMSEILGELVSEEERDKVMDRIENIKLSDLTWSDQEAKEWEEWLENSRIAEAKEEGLSEGIEQEKINIIKSMLENNANYELISRVTKKEIEEIKEIEDSMK